MWFVDRSPNGRLRISNIPPDNTIARFMSYNDALRFIQLEDARYKRKKTAFELVILLGTLVLLSALIP